jgi:hypothetical protein
MEKPHDPDHAASAVLTIAPNDTLTHLFVAPNAAFRELLRSRDGGKLIAMIVARLIAYRDEFQDDRDVRAQAASGNEAIPSAKNELIEEMEKAR